MEEKIIDFIGGVFMIMVLIGPVIIMILTWKFIDGSKAVRIVIGLFLSFVCAYFFFMISLAIIFRNGMGPG